VLLAASPFANASACLAQSAATTARAAALLMARGTAQGIVSDYVIQLSREVTRDMLFTKVKVMAVGFLGCLAVVAVVAAAVAQRSGGDDAKKETPRPPAAQATVKARPLPAEALAAHLGITHQSFELTFDKPHKVIVSVDVYENGKMVANGRAVESLDVDKKFAGSVLLSRGKEEGKLLMTLITPSGTLNDVIEDPFGGQLRLIYPGPRMDAEGRIPLALLVAEGENDASKVTLAKAAKAIVVQVRTK
jgi:hypothetical protein